MRDLPFDLLKSDHRGTCRELCKSPTAAGNYAVLRRRRIAMGRLDATANATARLFREPTQTIAPQPPSQSRFTPPVWSPPHPPQPGYDLGNNPVIQLAAGASQFLSRHRPLQQDIPLSSGLVNQLDPALTMDKAKDTPNPFEQQSPRTRLASTTLADFLRLGIPKSF